MEARLFENVECVTEPVTFSVNTSADTVAFPGAGLLSVKYEFVMFTVPIAKYAPYQVFA